MELNKGKKFLKYVLYAKLLKIVVVLAIMLVTNSCSISYKFNGASVDYTKTKTISIAEFPNTAELVYAPLSSEFTEKLREIKEKNRIVSPEMRFWGERVPHFRSCRPG